MGEGASWRDAAFEPLPVGKAETLLEGSDVAVLTIGPSAYAALEAAKAFPGKVGVYNFRFLKPVDEDALARIINRYRAIVTVEDGSVKGGLFGAVSEYVASHGGRLGVEGVGVPDRFITHARQSEQKCLCGMDVENLSKKIQKILEKSN